jgi:hypothetical protein
MMASFVRGAIRNTLKRRRYGDAAQPQERQQTPKCAGVPSQRMQRADRHHGGRHVDWRWNRMPKMN